jgi:hypothetical protein
LISHLGVIALFSSIFFLILILFAPDTILKLDTLVMIQTKFGFHWSCTFRGEDFWKSLRHTTDGRRRRQVMAIAHLTLWVRWANKKACIVDIKKNSGKNT